MFTSIWFVGSGFLRELNLFNMTFLEIRSTLILNSMCEDPDPIESVDFWPIGSASFLTGSVSGYFFLHFDLRSEPDSEFFPAGSGSDPW